MLRRHRLEAELRSQKNAGFLNKTMLAGTKKRIRENPGSASRHSIFGTKRLVRIGISSVPAQARSVTLVQQGNSRNLLEGAFPWTGDL